MSSCLGSGGLATIGASLQRQQRAHTWNHGVDGKGAITHRDGPSEAASGHLRAHWCEIHLFFDMFGNQRQFGDKQKEEFISAVSVMLEAKLVVAGGSEISEPLELRALGYIYGFVDSALRTIGQDMADTAVGLPITFQVLRKLFPGSEHEYLEFLKENEGNDATITATVVYGGQQYMDFENGKLAAPMGLAKTLISPHAR